MNPRPTLIITPRKIGKSRLLVEDLHIKQRKLLTGLIKSPTKPSHELLAWAVLVGVRPLGVINSYVAQQKKGEMPPRGQKRRSEKLRVLILDKLIQKPNNTRGI